MMLGVAAWVEASSSGCDIRAAAGKEQWPGR